MDLSLIQGTISGLKFASDMAKGFLDLKSLTEVQGKVIELQRAILSAQSSALAANADQAAMADEIRKLREQLAQLEAWIQEKQRYQLIALEAGVFAFALKPEAAAGEPPHWVCARCFSKGEKFVLQNQGDFYSASEHHLQWLQFKDQGVLACAPGVLTSRSTRRPSASLGSWLSFNVRPRKTHTSCAQ